MDKKTTRAILKIYCANLHSVNPSAWHSQLKFAEPYSFTEQDKNLLLAIFLLNPLLSVFNSRFICVSITPILFCFIIIVHISEEYLNINIFSVLEERFTPKKKHRIWAEPWCEDKKENNIQSLDWNMCKMR